MLFSWAIIALLGVTSAAPVTSKSDVDNSTIIQAFRPVSASRKINFPDFFQRKDGLAPMIITDDAEPYDFTVFLGRDVDRRAAYDSFPKFVHDKGDLIPSEKRDYFTGRYSVQQLVEIRALPEVKYVRTTPANGKYDVLKDIAKAKHHVSGLLPITMHVGALPGVYKVEFLDGFEMPDILDELSPGLVKKIHSFYGDSLHGFSASLEHSELNELCANFMVKSVEQVTYATQDGNQTLHINSASAEDHGPLKPLLEYNDPVPDSYFVFIADGYSLVQLLSTLPRSILSQIGGYYSDRFSGTFDSQQLRFLRHNYMVKHVAQDTHLYIQTTQKDVDYNLAMASGNERFPNSYRYRETYLSNKTGDQHAPRVFVLDTGYWENKDEFGDRYKQGPSYVSSEDNKDAEGHGTLVSAIIGSKTYGISKHATVESVQISSMGSTGLSYVLKHSRRGDIINISLGGATQDYYDNTEINALIAKGVHIVASAGNDGVLACEDWPAGVEGVITVGSIDSNFEVWESSNIGKCIDYFAPGVNITVLGRKGVDKDFTDLGTSLSAPYVAGLLHYFSVEFPKEDPIKLLSKYALKNRIVDFKAHGYGAPNLVATNGYLQGLGSKKTKNGWEDD